MIWQIFMGTHGTLQEGPKKKKKHGNVVYRRVWQILVSIQGTHPEKHALDSLVCAVFGVDRKEKKNGNKTRKRCVHNGLADFGKYARDTSRET